MTGLGSSCGACKFLRRKCINECVFAPYFCYEEGATHFAAVHKVFGASNVSKLLQHLPVQNRGEAAITISYEALARMRDPVYGCVAHIFALQQQVASLQEEIEILGTHVANFAKNGVTHGNSEEMNYPINGFGFASQEDAIHNYLNQQAPQPSCMLNTTDDIGLNYGEMNIQLPRTYGWRDQTLFYEATNEPTSSERFLVEMDQTFLTSDYPWLDNANYAEY